MIKGINKIIIILFMVFISRRVPAPYDPLVKGSQVKKGKPSTIVALTLNNESIYT